ncbi:alpha-(1,3)-fucosyltransferase C-like [Haliotis rubra]|uniref:alpha-(1,3)-fucosyltransferase C-like n=1 Tax=Haliotis rubra TaxID=36100 RepID=UPI001EE5AEB3|nr:alpha-(1,3)-fucosyltransferase C-like [Haliotis rubra]
MGPRMQKKWDTQMNHLNHRICIFLILCGASILPYIVYLCALPSHTSSDVFPLFDEIGVRQLSALKEHKTVDNRSPKRLKRSGQGKVKSNNVSNIHQKAKSDQTNHASNERSVEKAAQSYPVLQHTASRLVFKEAITKYWTPIDVVNMDLPFTNKSLTHYTGNGTKLIVIDRLPVWMEWALKGYMQMCRYSNCLLSTNGSLRTDADAVLFNGQSMSPKPPPRTPGQVWVIYAWESPCHLPKTMYKPEWKRELNWTLTYQTDSDLFSPVGMFVPVLKPHSYHHLLNIVQHKTKAVAWFVSHCRTESRRMAYVKRIQKIIDVDIFGNCGPMKCPRSDPKCLGMLQDTYWFYLSFENSFCKDYITEKLYKVFNDACVPVVRGGADYKHLVPNGTYIDAADFASPEALGRHLKWLMSNTSAYMDILMHKEQYRVLGSNHGKHMALCELCYRLNNLETRRSTQAGVEEWTEECHAPTDLG